MTKHLRDKHVEFRRLVVALDGDQAAIGIALGITGAAVSARLRSQLHRSWWQSVKNRRSERWRRNVSARYR